MIEFIGITIGVYWMFKHSGVLKSVMIWLSVISAVIGGISTLSFQGVIIGFFLPAMVIGGIFGLVFGSLKLSFSKYR